MNSRRESHAAPPAAAPDRWDAGSSYEPYVGRWSRIVAGGFLDWLGVPSRSRWLEVGCGTGALTAAVSERMAPAALTACEPSAEFLGSARARMAGRGVEFVCGVVEDVPIPARGFDACVSGLVLNFIADPRAALAAMRARVRPGGTIAAYVWDYASGMQMMRAFWDAAVALDPAARGLDEGVRFPLCRREPLRALWKDAGFGGVEVCELVVATPFRDFADLWEPFLGGQGPAPSYLMSLDPAGRDALRDDLRRRVQPDPSGRILLTASAWAVRGTC